MRDQAEKLRILARTIKNQVESEIKGNGKKPGLLLLPVGKAALARLTLL